MQHWIVAEIQQRGYVEYLTLLFFLALLGVYLLYRALALIIFIMLVNFIALRPLTWRLKY